MSRSARVACSGPCPGSSSTAESFRASERATSRLQRALAAENPFAVSGRLDRRYRGRPVANERREGRCVSSERHGSGASSVSANAINAWFGGRAGRAHHDTSLRKENAFMSTSLAHHDDHESGQQDPSWRGYWIANCHGFRGRRPGRPDRDRRGRTRRWRRTAPHGEGRCARTASQAHPGRRGLRDPASRHADLAPDDGFDRRERAGPLGGTRSAVGPRRLARKALSALGPA